MREGTNSSSSLDIGSGVQGGEDGRDKGVGWRREGGAAADQGCLDLGGAVQSAQRMQLRELVGGATGSSAAGRSGSEETMRARRCLDSAPWSAGAATARLRVGDG
jgi:hypothetical protein